MQFLSTRNSSVNVASSFAILNGISKEGGLFVPENIPVLTSDDFNKLSVMNYPERAAFVLGKFLTDFTEDELKHCTEGAYIGSFDNDQPAPIAVLGENTNILELWHGPTCAFKDLALQILPYLLTTSAKHESTGKKTVILVATSGDTGKAALEGFKDVTNTEIIVFYPVDGVSPMQKLQMDSQKGSNVHVCAINGNFDDAQTGVKKIFTDNSVKDMLSTNGMEFSSANSINFGRLAPQIVYYISAYLDMLAKGDNLKEGFNVVVPTGNFGNILAAFYAKQMGVPINKLICASNKNNVLTDFINTGVYDRNRKFHTTVSPSMDILISSNLERMLFHLCSDDKYISEIMDKLSKEGKYTVTPEIKKQLSEIFYADFCDDEQTLQTIGKTFKEYGYLCDTHTAVAVNVYEKYTEKTGDKRPTVIASTASPYKFAQSVLTAVTDKKGKDEFDEVELLSSVTSTDIPSPIAALKDATVRFKDVYEKDNMLTAVKNCLNLK